MCCEMVGWHMGGWVRFEGWSGWKGGVRWMVGRDGIGYSMTDRIRYVRRIIWSWSGIGVMCGVVLCG